MIRRLHAVLACAAWLPAAAALATQEPPKVQLRAVPAEAPVVVAPAVVEATTPAELRKQTFGFVETFAASTEKLDRLARWEEPVCVAVLGLVPDQSAQVKARLDEVAKALNVKVAKAGCNPNLEIFFADQPQQFLDHVADTREDLLGYWHHRDRETLKTMTHPIQAWYVTASKSRSNGGVGTAFAYVDTTEANAGSNQQTNGESIDDPDVKAVAPGCAESRLSNCMKSVFNHVMIVVDNGRVRGESPGLIADYVTMLAFAQPRTLEGCNTLPSVIDLFACRRPDPVQGLTRADVAYLEGLYRIDAEARKTSQLADLSSRMADMLIKADKVDRLAAQRGATKTSARGR